MLLTVLVLVVPALLDGGGEEPSGRADSPLPSVLEVAPTRTIRIEGQDDRGPPVPEAQVPPAPIVPPADSPAPEALPAEAVAAVDVPAQDPVPVDLPAATAVTPSDPPPVPAASTPPPAAPAAAAPPAGDWVVQLGSFANGPNAERLAGQVRAKGFAATVSETGTGSARRYRVRSGAATTREAADRLAADIKAAGFQVTVVRR
ncbi:MAG: SPOR domain-containing protein [Chromatiales bacterium]|nr:SPOR domain-containing protein [Chromatiales bacterium]